MNLKLRNVVMEEVKDASGGGAAGSGGGAPAGGAGAGAPAGGAAAPAAGAPGGEAGGAGAPAGAAGAAAGGEAAGGAAAGGDGKAYWPGDWQNRISKGDEKRASHIKRYASPEAMADALIAAQNRIRSGELKPVLAKDAKPEEIAAWRKDMGIPEKPDGYDLKFDDGFVIGADDKPIVDGFLARAHESNLLPNQVKGVVQWYYKEQERQAEERASKDDKERVETLDALNVEWGRDFRRNVNMIHSVMSRFPADVREALEGARLPDGRGIFNHPEIMRGFAALALELNPAGVVPPNEGGDIAQALNDEIAQIEKWMHAPRKSADGKKYWADDKTQSRYRQLLEMREKQQKAA